MKALIFGNKCISQTTLVRLFPLKRAINDVQLNVRSIVYHFTPCRHLELLPLIADLKISKIPIGPTKKSGEAL